MTSLVLAYHFNEDLDKFALVAWFNTGKDFTVRAFEDLFLSRITQVLEFGARETEF